MLVFFPPFSRITCGVYSVQVPSSGVAKGYKLENKLNLGSHIRILLFRISNVMYFLASELLNTCWFKEELAQQSVGWVPLHGIWQVS